MGRTSDTGEGKGRKKLLQDKQLSKISLSILILASQIYFVVARNKSIQEQCY